jgi:pimeloyl-ACP methyl ester carboxylesterase
MFKEDRFAAAGVTLNVARGPDAGPPLLLLHGVTRRWQDYVPLAPVFAVRWRVHALDFRGHGKSGRAPGHYRVADHVNDALGLVRQLDEPVVIYGHSLGALVACGVAARAPERVRGVVLEDPPSARLVLGIRQTPFHAFFAGMQRLASNGMTVAERTRLLAEMRLPVGIDQPPVRLGDIRDPTSLRFSARCLQDLDPDVLAPLLELYWLEGYDQASLMAQVRCPALLLRADERFGGMMPRTDAEQLTARMADCTVIDLMGCGHAVHWLEGEKTVRYVVGFLESLQ